MNNTINNFVCLGCECVCDDLTATTDGRRLNLVSDCDLAGKWAARPLPDQPFVSGVATDLDSAFTAATELWSNAKSRLVTNFGDISTEAQRAATKLARQSNALIDPSCTLLGRASTFALQRQGLVTGTLGEMRSRSDLVIFWFCDTTESHPRFVERFVNRKATKVYVTQVENSEKILRGNDRVRLENPVDCLQQLIWEFSKSKPAEGKFTPLSGPSKEVSKLVRKIKDAQHVSFVYTSQIVDSRFDDMTDLLVEFVRVLNQHLPALGYGLRFDRNSLSAENVMTWSTGTPFGVGFREEQASHDWGFFAPELIEQHRCDVIVLGSPNRIPVELHEHLRETQTICLVEDKASESLALELNCDVILPIALPGISCGGTWCRMDDVPLPLQSPLSSEWPTAKSVFEAIGKSIQEFAT